MAKDSKNHPVTANERSFMKLTHDFDITVKTTMGKVTVEKDGTIIVRKEIVSKEERHKVGKEVKRLLDIMHD